MKKIVLLVLLAVHVVFLTGCVEVDLGSKVHENEGFKFEYFVGDRMPDFGDSFIVDDGIEIEFEIELNGLDMNIPGIYIVTININEKDNPGNQLLLEIQVMINDQKV